MSRKPPLTFFFGPFLAPFFFGAAWGGWWWGGWLSAWLGCRSEAWVRGMGDGTVGPYLLFEVRCKRIKGFSSSDSLFHARMLPLCDQSHHFNPTCSLHTLEERAARGGRYGWSGPLSTAILSDGSISLILSLYRSRIIIIRRISPSVSALAHRGQPITTPTFHLSSIRTAPLPSAVSRSGTAPAPHIHAPAYRRRPSGTYDYMYIASLL